MQDQPIESTVEFRDIPGFPGYRISKTGIVQSCRRRGTLSLSQTWKTLTNTSRGRYFQVGLRKNGKYCAPSVHRLVLLAFVGECPNGMECRHLNGDGRDNRLENLKWDTHKTNCEDQITHGTSLRAEKNGNSKLTAELVKELRQRVADGEMVAHVAKEYGVTSACAHDAVRGIKTWKHLDGRVTKDLKRRKQLTDEQMSDAKRRIAEGFTVNEICQDYNMSRRSLSRILMPGRHRHAIA